MAVKSTKQNLLFTLDRIEMPSRQGKGTVRHLLTAELVWPRTTVAKRSSVLNVPLVNGVCDTSVWSLTNRLVFKEPCEHLFGLRVSVSEPVTRTSARKFIRYLAGHAVAEAGDAAGELVPGKLDDELVSLPFAYLSKQLLGNCDPDLLAEGCADLDSAQFGEAPVQVEVPLIAARTVVRRSGGRRSGRLDGTPEPATAQTLVSRGDADGRALFTVTAF